MNWGEYVFVDLGEGADPLYEAELEVEGREGGTFMKLGFDLDFIGNFADIGDRGGAGKGGLINSPSNLNS